MNGGFEEFPGGEIEIIGRAMTKEERARRQAAAAEELAANPSWDNPNYIPVEELVDPILLESTSPSDWDDDGDWGDDDV